MVKVTEQAAEVLSRSLEQAELEPGQTLRLVRQGDEGFALAADTPAETDQVIEHQGSPILLIGEEVGNAIGETTIDVQSGPQGAQLVLRPQ